MKGNSIKIIIGVVALYCTVSFLADYYTRKEKPVDANEEVCTQARDIAQTINLERIKGVEQRQWIGLAKTEVSQEIVRMVYSTDEFADHGQLGYDICIKLTQGAQ